MIPACRRGSSLLSRKESLVGRCNSHGGHRAALHGSIQQRPHPDHPAGADPGFPCFVVHPLVGEHAALVFIFCLPSQNSGLCIHPVTKKTLMRLCCGCSLGWDTGTPGNCVLSFVVTCSVYAFTVCVPIYGGQVWRPSPCFRCTCVARCGVSQPLRCCVRLLFVRSTSILTYQVLQ